jgi:hypothetical protein
MRSEHSQEPKMTKCCRSLIGVLPALTIACSGVPVSSTTAALEAVCVDESADLAGWFCPDELVAECNLPGAAAVDEILVAADEQTCAELNLEVEPGPFALGTHEVTVIHRNGILSFVVKEICRASLEVVDTTPPEVETQVVQLWSPNHKMETVAVADCVAARDVCDSEVEVVFTYATSDEPDNAKGDGNAEPDIQFLSATEVALRAERQGGSNGRVYNVGWRAVDDAGNAVEGACRVEVPHDQSGQPAVDDGPVVQVDAP